MFDLGYLRQALSHTMSMSRQRRQDLWTVACRLTYQSLRDLLPVPDEGRQDDASQINVQALPIVQ